MRFYKKLIAGITLFFSIATFSLNINDLNGAFSVIKKTNDNNSYVTVNEIMMRKSENRTDTVVYSVDTEKRSNIQEIQFENIGEKTYVSFNDGFAPEMYEVVEKTDFDITLKNIDNPEDILVLSYNKTHNDFDYEGYYRYLSTMRDNELKDKLRDMIKNHHYLGYTGAREEMFGNIDNFDGIVTGVYTGKTMKTSGIPDHTVMNCEHTWPQSQFGGGETTAKKSDLFHLYPTDSKANSKRSSYHFGNITTVDWEDGGSKFGYDEDGYTKFEPRDDHKGNVARSIFYFATRYNKTVPSWEEEVLREWHVQDPVDEEEFRRNGEIEELQHNRNPFIDHPEYVDQISDF